MSPEGAMASLAALPTLAGRATLQRFGRRPPGLPESVRNSTEWEGLRREIYARGMRLHNGVTYDFRVLLTDARQARTAGRLMWQMVRGFAPEVLLGPGFGATPLLFNIVNAALDDGVELKVLMVRDQRKGHNQKRWIEGDQAAATGRRALFVDDFMKRGSALELVKQALAAEKLDVNLVAASLFYDMWDPLVSRQLGVHALPVVALYTRHDLALSRDCFDARPPAMGGAHPPLIAAKPRWWRYDLHRRRRQNKKCTPVIAGGAVYVADDASTLWKHDLQSGDIEWSVPSVQQPLKGIVQLLQHVEGSIVYACYDGALTRVDAASGEIMWRRRIDSHIHATPTIDAPRGRLFINTEQWNEGEPTGHVQCVELAGGRVRWKHRLRWWPPGSTAYCPASDIVVAPCNDRTLTGLDAASGTPRWQVKTAGLVRGRPAIAAGRLYAASEQGHLHCIDVASGALLWTARYGDPAEHQFVTIAGDVAVLVDGKWHVAAFDLANGALRWVTRLREAGCWGVVPYGPYLVALAEDGNIALIAPDAEVKLWEGRVPGIHRQPAAVGEGTLVVASNSAGLIAYDVDPRYAHVAEAA